MTQARNRHETPPKKVTIFERVREAVREEFDARPSQLFPDSRFRQDLGLDSLSFVALRQALEAEFGVDLPVNEAPETLAEAAKQVERALEAGRVARCPDLPDDDGAAP